MKGSVKVKSTVSVPRVVSHVGGISAGKIQEMGKDVVKEAKAQMASLHFKESTGAAVREIHYTKTGAMKCEVAASSGHTSFIEWGSQYIQEKRATIWPAYRAVKKLFMGGRRWL